MANLYRREGGIWWAWGYDRHGKRWRRSTKQKDKNAARTVAAKIEQELALDADQPRDEACTLEAACNLMLQAAERAGRAEGTIDFLTTKSRHLIRLLGGNKRCSKITLRDTTEYAQTRLDEGAHKSTVFYEIRTLVQALRRARKLGLYKPEIDPALLKPEELAGAYIPRERWLPPSEYEALLAELDPGRTEHKRLDDRRDYVAVWCQTGMRDSELYRLRPEHCDFETRVVYVPGTKTQKSKGRPVPMTANVEAILRRRLDALKVNDKVPPNAEIFKVWGQVRRDLYVACLRIEARLNPGWEPPELEGEDREKAKRRRTVGQPTPKKERVRPPVPFDPVTPNDFRRTFASWLAQAGVPLFTAAKLMGHGSTKMLERVYARLAPQTLRDAVDRLPESVTNPEAKKKDE